MKYYKYNLQLYKILQLILCCVVGGFLSEVPHIPYLGTDLGKSLFCPIRDLSRSPGLPGSFRASCLRWPSELRECYCN